MQLLSRRANGRPCFGDVVEVESSRIGVLRKVVAAEA